MHVDAVCMWMSANCVGGDYGKKKSDGDVEGGVGVRGWGWCYGGTG